MKFGIIVTDDDVMRGGEVGVGNHFIERFSNRKNIYQDTFVPIYAISGTLPNDDVIKSYDGLIVTGSHHSVNEDVPWIHALEEFIRNAYQLSLGKSKLRIYGMCFGHQIIAKAFGGRVAQNPSKQFYFGTTKVRVNTELMKQEFVGMHFNKKSKPVFKMMKLHGECVIEVPKVARQVGTSRQCKNEILMYGKNILTSQGHPEYTVTDMKGINAVVAQKSADPLYIEKQLLHMRNKHEDMLTEMVRSFLRSEKLNLQKIIQH